MLTYSKWNDVLATCRLRNYDPSLIKKLFAKTSKISDETQAVSFPHLYELISTLVTEDQNLSSSYFVFEHDESSPNTLNFLAKALCPNTHFWLIALCLFKLSIFTDVNVNKLLQQLQYCDQLFRAITSLMRHNEYLITSTNIEALLIHASRSEAVSTTLSQLVQKQSLFKPYATQKQWDALINYPGADVDLVHLHKLFSEVFSTLSLAVFEIALAHAPHAVYLQIIFNLIDKSKIDTTLYLKKLIDVKSSIHCIAETLQYLKLNQASLNERTYFFIKLIQHGKQFDQFHDFFSQVKQHLLPPALEPLFQLLFQHASILPYITRFFTAFNKWNSNGLNVTTVEFIFRYRTVLFDIQLLQHLESLPPKLITAERLANILQTCAHYETEQAEDCLTKLLDLLRDYHTSPVVSNEVKVERRTADKRLRFCNSDLKRYLKELDDNPAMSVSELDEWDSDQFHCPISGVPIITPVRVGACPMVMDLLQLLTIKPDGKGYRSHPGTRDGFLVNEIIPARDVAKAIEAALKESKQHASSESDGTAYSETSDEESSSLPVTP